MTAKDPNVTEQPVDPRASVVPYHTMHSDGVLAELRTDAAIGLSAAEAARRLEEHGPNAIREKEPVPAWKLFLGQFQDVMIWVLMVAAVLAGLQGEWVDTIAIVAILLLNAVMGFVQEFRAEQALSALKKLAAPSATVLRDGAEIELAALDLVPGDIILLEAGDQIPGDARLIEVGMLQVIESALTGESEPVHKSTAPVAEGTSALGDRFGMVYAGTAVSVGRGKAVVTATGAGTEVGRIADLLSEQEEEATPLQRDLDQVGKRIAILVLLIALLIFVEQLAAVFLQSGHSFAATLKDPAFATGFTAALLIAVSLAVAAIPEGLPAVVTIAMSIGVRRMAERNAIVRRLTAVETLGSTTFICSDKTGTLTKNEMAVRRAIIGADIVDITADWTIEPAEKDPEPGDLALLLEMAAANNDARPNVEGGLLGDPTETALLEAAEHLAPGHIRPRRTSELPFDSERKRMTTVHESDGARVAYVKGGADVVIALCTHARLRGEVVALDDAGRQALLALNEQLAAGGYRTLSFAMRALEDEEDVRSADDERELTYVGIMGLVDPPRLEVGDALAECRKAGISVAMVTGDHALTARAIATQIGLLPADAPDSAVVTGAELSSMSDEQLSARAEEIHVYARVNPEDKIRIVSALRADGETVAMTGDGVNDAPALKRADIGVSMGLIGTDVAREASDMVLADDDFSTIVEAVRQGRTVFDNLQKVILFLLSCNMSEVLVVFTMAIFVTFRPEHSALALIPLQLLWINLVTDGPPALALGVDPADPRVMERKPRRTGEAILSAHRIRELVIQGAIMTGGALAATFAAGPLLGSSDMAERTILFSTLVFSQMFHAFNYRTWGASVLSAEAFKNRWLIGALVPTLVLQAIVVHWAPMQELFRTTGLSAAEWSLVFGSSLIGMFLMDLVEAIEGRRRNEEDPANG